MLPLFLRIKVFHSGHRGFRFWLPLFLLWPIVLLIALCLLPFLLIAAFVVWRMGWPVRLFKMLGAFYSLLSALRGLSVFVKSRKENADVKFQID